MQVPKTNKIHLKKHFQNKTKTSQIQSKPLNEQKQGKIDEYHNKMQVPTIKEKLKTSQKPSKPSTKQNQGKKYEQLK